jgi:hypothetical protein
MDHPLRQFSTRIPSLPGHPLYCPECWATARFDEEEDRDLHYLQHHVLDTPKEMLSNRMILIDYGNYDGPMGRKQHVFPAERFVQEPESFLTEAERRKDRDLEKEKRGEMEVCTEGQVEQRD